MALHVVFPEYPKGSPGFHDRFATSALQLLKGSRIA